MSVTPLRMLLRTSLLGVGALTLIATSPSSNQTEADADGVLDGSVIVRIELSSHALAITQRSELMVQYTGLDAGVFAPPASIYLELEADPEVVAEGALLGVSLPDIHTLCATDADPCSLTFRVRTEPAAPLNFVANANLWTASDASLVCTNLEEYEGDDLRIVIVP